MTIRQERIQELIHTHLSQLLMTEVTDPALRNVTVTDIKIDREIEYADIYVNALGDEHREKEVMAGLKRANGFLRKEIAARLKIRHMPVLHFHWDRNLQAALDIEELLDAVKAKDAARTEPPAQPE